MEVYGNEALKGAFKRAFGLSMPDAIYIDMNWAEGREFSEKAGLSLAERMAAENPDKKIIIHGIDPIQKLWLDTRFKKAMTYTNIVYVHMPFNITGIVEKYNEKGLENPALNAVANLNYEGDTVGYIRHGFAARREEGLKRAREELGWSGTDEEIEKRLMEYEPKNIVEPQSFPGVFCDIEGTLMKDEKLNNNLVKELREYSKDKPVNVWTGANLEEVVPFLWNNRIEYPLLSKDWFKGSEAELVIDDMDAAEFEQMFGIKARQFIRV